MEVKLGYTSIICRQCKDVSIVENSTLGAITEHVCPCCGLKMTDREIGKLKMHYYLLCEQIYKEIGAPMVELFDYDIRINPKLEPDNT